MTIIQVVVIPTVFILIILLNWPMAILTVMRTITRIILLILIVITHDDADGNAVDIDNDYNCNFGVCFLKFLGHLNYKYRFFISLSY